MKAKSSQEGTVEDKAVAFSVRFVKRFEQKISDFHEIFTNTKEKAGKTSDLVVPICKSAGSSTFHVTTGIGLVFENIGKKIYKKNAKKLTSCVYKYNNQPKECREIMASAALETFYMFEYQLNQVESDGNCFRALEKIADDAVNRIYDYFKQHPKDHITVATILRGVITGESKNHSIKSAIAHSFSGCSSGHSVMYNTCSESVKWKTSKIFEEAGLLVLNKDNQFIKYKQYKESRRHALFSKFNKVDEFYGYRKSCDVLTDWETGDDFEMIQDAKPNSQAYLLNSNQKMELLQKITSELEESKSLKSKVNIKKIDFFFNVAQSLKSFVDRDGKFDLINKGLMNKKIVVVTGFPGTGKSELVRKYAHKHKNNFDGNVIFLNAGNSTSLKQSIDSLINDHRFFKIKKTDAKNSDDIIEFEKDSKFYIKSIYEGLGSSKSLFIFDDASDYETLQQYLPVMSNSVSILVTSGRRKSWDSERENAPVKLELGQFTYIEAMTFLKDFIGDDDTDDLKPMDDLIDMLDSNPLALSQAAAYIKNIRSVRGSGFKIRDYLKRIGGKKTEMLKTNFHGSDAYPKTFIATLNVSMQKIAKKKEAMEIMNVIAFLNPVRIPLNIFEGLFNCETVDEAAYLLNDYCLIDKDVKDSNNFFLFKVHGLVQEYVRDMLEISDKNTVIALALKLLQEFMSVSSENYDVGVPHAVTVWKFASENIELVKSYILQTVGEDTYLHILSRHSPLNVIEDVLANIKEEVFEKEGIENYTPLQKALLRDPSEETTKVVKLMIEKGSKAIAKNKTKMTPLHTASLVGNNDIVEYLVSQHKANVNALTETDWTPLHMAAYNGHLEVLQYLIANGADINLRTSMGSTLLHLAAGNGHISVVHYLVCVLKVQYFESKRSNKWTPLHLACENGHFEVVSILVNIKDANLNILGGEQFTALRFAVSRGHFEIVKLLLEKGVSIFVINDTNTVLHQAVYGENPDIIELIINEIKCQDEENFDNHINAADIDGDTPLMWAAEQGSPEAASVLLKHGADVTKKNKSNKTAYDWAVNGSKPGNKLVAEMLHNQNSD